MFFRDVRVATIPAFASVVENPSVTSDAVDRVITQMTDVVSASASDYHEHSYDGTLLGLHSVQLELVQTACKIAATAHPKFRDECRLWVPGIAFLVYRQNKTRLRFSMWPTLRILSKSIKSSFRGSN